MIWILLICLKVESGECVAHQAYQYSTERACRVKLATTQILKGLRDQPSWFVCVPRSKA